MEIQRVVFVLERTIKGINLLTLVVTKSLKRFCHKKTRYNQINRVSEKLCQRKIS